MAIKRSKFMKSLDDPKQNWWFKGRAGETYFCNTSKINRYWTTGEQAVEITKSFYDRLRKARVNTIVRGRRLEPMKKGKRVGAGKIIHVKKTIDTNQFFVR